MLFLLQSFQGKTIHNPFTAMYTTLLEEDLEKKKKAENEAAANQLLEKVLVSCSIAFLGGFTFGETNDALC